MTSAVSRSIVAEAFRQQFILSDHATAQTLEVSQGLREQGDDLSEAVRANNALRQQLQNKDEQIAQLQRQHDDVSPTL